MNEDSVLYVGASQTKAPVQIRGKHKVLGDYEVKLTPEWRIVNKTGQATWADGKFTGVAAGEIGLIATVVFGDGSSKETPEIPINVIHIIPDEIYLAPRAKVT